MERLKSGQASLAARASQWRHPSGVVVRNADFCAIGLGSNPREVIDVCKCIMPLRHESSLNSCRATSTLVRLVEEEEV
ncbi:hypothetical protein TNCV_4763191 [Trichonephila clavipes]|nr:hypothetical protein TNCV_4763191 [Trichonephila clavipes]